MPKFKNIPKSIDPAPKAPAKPAAPAVQSHAVRETVESIVIAFVLAFLFRTFEAEAFVIPTGSMAPTLMGRHKDVDCPKCGYRYTVSASEEESQDADRPPSECLAGMCPMCHYVLPMRATLPDGAPEQGRADATNKPSYNGDRILVNKYLYSFTKPKRWEVVVFKYPGDAKVNYIKRLVGLPGETLRVYHGDLFVRPTAERDEEFAIIRKPADKIFALRQLVHDTEYDPAELDAAGWPLRWHATPGDSKGWKLEKTIDGTNVRQNYSVDATGDTTSWLRYEHIVPTYAVWQAISAGEVGPDGQKRPLVAEYERSQLRRLITDSNPYDGREDRAHLYHPNRSVNSRDTLEIDHNRQGIHWVGDLMLEADVNVESAEGELLLDLVEGGQHFGCAIDLKSGEAKLSITGLAEFSPKAATSLTGPGEFHVAFANIDDQLSLWIDGDLVSFEGDTTYDAAKIFGERSRILPKTSDDDLGDLAPAGIGARGAKLAVDRLQVWRDIYYIADSAERNNGETVTDFKHPLDPQILELPMNPKLWDRFTERQSAEFPLNSEQLFVMGDNSAESSDARLWLNGDRRGAQPGGAYLEKRLLIGKALCVYWPHAWPWIPPIPFPPNVADMRLVR